MVERRAGSQTGNLTPDHKKSRIDLISVCSGEVRHTVGKLSRRATSSLQTLSQSEVKVRSYECPKSQESKPGQFRDSFGTPLWESWDKESFGRGCGGVMQKILYGGRWWVPSSPGCGESSESMLPKTCPNTEGVSKDELTLLWLVLDAGPSS
jgi:hypothetical protein